MWRDNKKVVGTVGGRYWAAPQLQGQWDITQQMTWKKTALTEIGIRDKTRNPVDKHLGIRRLVPCLKMPQLFKRLRAINNPCIGLGGSQLASRTIWRVKRRGRERRWESVGSWKLPSIFQVRFHSTRSSHVTNFTATMLKSLTAVNHRHHHRITALSFIYIRQKGLWHVCDKRKQQ